MTSLTEITLQDLASAGVFQPAYGLLLDLAHTLARQVEFLTDLLQGHRVAAVQPEVQADDILLPLRQGGDGSVNFFAQRLIQNIDSFTSASVISSTSAISSALGSRSNSCSNLA